MTMSDACTARRQMSVARSPGVMKPSIVITIAPATLMVRMTSRPMLLEVLDSRTHIDPQRRHDSQLRMVAPDAKQPLPTGMTSTTSPAPAR
jgi:hypothetical protein